LPQGNKGLCPSSRQGRRLLEAVFARLCLALHLRNFLKKVSACLQAVNHSKTFGLLVECVNYELVDGVAEGVHIGGAVDAAREDDLVAGQLFYDRFDGFEDLFTSDERFGKVECAHIVKSFAEVEDPHRFKRGAVLCGVDGICIARGDKVVAR